jgi:hypothetical protein
MPTELLTATEIATIEEYRHARRWSYRQLAADVSQRTKILVPEVTLYKAIAEPRRKLRSTTVYPIRLYLSLMQRPAPEPKPAAPRRSKSSRQPRALAAGAGR